MKYLTITDDGPVFIRSLCDDGSIFKDVVPIEDLTMSFKTGPCKDESKIDPFSCINDKAFADQLQSILDENPEES